MLQIQQINILLREIISLQLTRIQNLLTLTITVVHHSVRNKIKHFNARQTQPLYNSKKITIDNQQVKIKDRFFA